MFIFPKNDNRLIGTIVCLMVLMAPAAICPAADNSAIGKSADRPTIVDTATRYTSEFTKGTSPLTKPTTKLAA